MTPPELDPVAITYRERPPLVSLRADGGSPAGPTEPAIGLAG